MRIDILGVSIICGLSTVREEGHEEWKGKLLELARRRKIHQIEGIKLKL
jgi:hypothetical protein